MKILKENIWCIFLFLFSLGTFDMTGEILTLCLLGYLLCFFGRNTKVDGMFFLVVSFSFFYFIDYYYNWGLELEKIILYLFMPWACYFLGKNYSERNSLQETEKVILSMAIGFYLHGVLNVIEYLTIYGFDYHWRIAYDFWQKRVISTTGCGLYFIPLTSFCVSNLYVKNGWKNKLFSILVIAGSIATCIIFSNRTLIYIIAILLIIGQLFFISSKNIRLQSKIIYILFMIALCVLVICTWKVNFCGIRDAILELKLVDRLINSSSRVDLWRSFFESNPWKYPLGGMQVELVGQENYVHNLWLDTFYTVGIMPFLLLVIITFGILRKLFLVSKNALVKKQTYQLNMVFLMLGMLLGCCVEPIMQNNPYYFAILIINMGLLKGMVGKQN